MLCAELEPWAQGDPSLNWDLKAQTKGLISTLTADRKHECHPPPSTDVGNQVRRMSTDSPPKRAFGLEVLPKPGIRLSFTQ